MTKLRHLVLAADFDGPIAANNEIRDNNGILPTTGPWRQYRFGDSIVPLHDLIDAIFRHLVKQGAHISNASQRSILLNSASENAHRLAAEQLSTFDQVFGEKRPFMTSEERKQITEQVLKTVRESMFPFSEFETLMRHIRDNKEKEAKQLLEGKGITQGPLSGNRDFLFKKFNEEKELLTNLQLYEKYLISIAGSLLDKTKRPLLEALKATFGANHLIFFDDNAHYAEPSELPDNTTFIHAHPFAGCDAHQMPTPYQHPHVKWLAELLIASYGSTEEALNSIDADDEFPAHFKWLLRQHPTFYKQEAEELFPTDQTPEQTDLTTLANKNLPLFEALLSELPEKHAAIPKLLETHLSALANQMAHTDTEFKLKVLGNRFWHTLEKLSNIEINIWPLLSKILSATPTHLANYMLLNRKKLNGSTPKFADDIFAIVKANETINLNEHLAFLIEHSYTPTEEIFASEYNSYILLLVNQQIFQAQDSQNFAQLVSRTPNLNGENITQTFLEKFEPHKFPREILETCRGIFTTLCQTGMTTEAAARHLIQHYFAKLYLKPRLRAHGENLTQGIGQQCASICDHREKPELTVAVKKLIATLIPGDKIASYTNINSDAITALKRIISVTGYPAHSYQIIGLTENPAGTINKIQLKNRATSETVEITGTPLLSYQISNGELIITISDSQLFNKADVFFAAIKCLKTQRPTHEIDAAIEQLWVSIRDEREPELLTAIVATDPIEYAPGFTQTPLYFIVRKLDKRQWDDKQHGFIAKEILAQLGNSETNYKKLTNLAQAFVVLITPFAEQGKELLLTSLLDANSVPHAALAELVFYLSKNPIKGAKEISDAITEKLKGEGFTKHLESSIALLARNFTGCSYWPSTSGQSRHYDNAVLVHYWQKSIKQADGLLAALKPIINDITAHHAIDKLPGKNEYYAEQIKNIFVAAIPLLPKELLEHARIIREIFREKLGPFLAENILSNIVKSPHLFGLLDNAPQGSMEFNLNSVAASCAEEKIQRALVAAISPHLDQSASAAHVLSSNLDTLKRLAGTNLAEFVYQTQNLIAQIKSIATLGGRGITDENELAQNILKIYLGVLETSDEELPAIMAWQLLRNADGTLNENLFYQLLDELRNTPAIFTKLMSHVTTLQNDSQVAQAIAFSDQHFFNRISITDHIQDMLRLPRTVNALFAYNNEETYLQILLKKQLLTLNTSILNNISKILEKLFSLTQQDADKSAALAKQLLIEIATNIEQLPEEIKQNCLAVQQASQNPSKALDYLLLHFVSPLISNPTLKQLPAAHSAIQNQNLEKFLSTLKKACGWPSSTNQDERALGQHLVTMLLGQNIDQLQLEAGTNPEMQLEQHLVMPGKAYVEIVLQSPLTHDDETYADNAATISNFPRAIQVVKVTNFDGSTEYYGRTTDSKTAAAGDFDPIPPPLATYSVNADRINFEPHVNNLLLIQTAVVVTEQAMPEAALLEATEGVSQQNLAHLRREMTLLNPATTPDDDIRLAHLGLAATALQELVKLITEFKAQLAALNNLDRLSRSQRDRKEALEKALKLIEFCETITAPEAQQSTVTWQQTLVGLGGLVVGIMGMVAPHINHIEPSEFDRQNYSTLLPLLAQDIDLGKTAAALGAGGILAYVIRSVHDVGKLARHAYQHHQATDTKRNTPSLAEALRASAETSGHLEAARLSSREFANTTNHLDVSDIFLRTAAALKKLTKFKPDPDNAQAGPQQGSLIRLQALLTPRAPNQQAEDIFNNAVLQHIKENRKRWGKNIVGAVETAAQVGANTYGLIALFKVIHAILTGALTNETLDEFGQAADLWGNVGSKVLTIGAIMVIILAAAHLLNLLINFGISRWTSTLPAGTGVTSRAALHPAPAAATPVTATAADLDTVVVDDNDPTEPLLPPDRTTPQQ